ncbi:MAG: PAS domain S-box protein [Planctomycetota bacterium]
MPNPVVTSGKIFQAVVEATPNALIMTDSQGLIVLVNTQAEKLFGYTREELLHKSIDMLVPQKFRGQHKSNRDSFMADPRTRAMGIGRELFGQRKDGSTVPIEIGLNPTRTDDGAYVLAAIVDITERKRLEDQLRHSQKMESIGRLAGGIAHDFNNMLMVISGYCSMAVDGAKDDAKLREQLEQIGMAADRATALTRQLLAFSRKQVLQPTVLDLNTVVEHMDKMLRRLIGEDIDFVTELRPHLDAVNFDRGQIEQIIMNLAINARDAMPKGGKLTIETANVVLDDTYARTHLDANPGPHVMIAVADTGSGMDAETLTKIFEPFFTTKGQGEGTGLGLATVYGIIKQAGGTIWVYSEVGHGTIFKVYLPSFREGQVTSKPPAEKVAADKGTETILVVDDEKGVRELLRAVLKAADYQVLIAGEIDEAMDICRKHEGRIHMLLTDVVLPKVGGRELAERLKAVRPDLKVVFMSGYTDGAIAHQGVLDTGTAFIEKPVAPQALLQKIREFLA